MQHRDVPASHLQTGQQAVVSSSGVSASLEETGNSALKQNLSWHSSHSFLQPSAPCSAPVLVTLGQQLPVVFLGLSSMSHWNGLCFKFTTFQSHLTPASSVLQHMVTTNHPFHLSIHYFTALSLLLHCLPKISVRPFYLSPCMFFLLLSFRHLLDLQYTSEERAGPSAGTQDSPGREYP